MERGISIRLRLLGALTLVTLIAATAYAAVALKVRRDAIIREADGKLLVAACGVKAWLGPDYHDRIVDRHSITKAEFDGIVAAHDRICLETGLQYLWSVMVLDGRIVFTSATHSVLTDPTSDCATFLEEHTDPRVHDIVLATMRPHYSTFDNKWGKGRMVLLPEYDRHGRQVIHAASIRLSELESALARTVVESFVISAVILLAALGVSWLLARSLSVPLIQLTEAAHSMAQGNLDVRLTPGGSRELIVLCESLDTMRKAIRTQLATLRQEIAVRREAEQKLRDNERESLQAIERNQRLVQEVEHRVRNNLAGLISLVGLMKVTSKDLDAFATAIEGRLRAMAHVQRMLVESQWGQVELRELIRSTLDAMSPLARHEHRALLDGPPVSLMPEQVTPLTLVLVEWFTNSCKYGAHSTAQGRLKIHWEIRLQVHDPHIRLTWQERGGPRIDRPITPSLGTELVYGFVTRELRGQCWLQFPPEGADHAIEFPCLLSALPSATAGAAPGHQRSAAGKP